MPAASNGFSSKRKGLSRKRCWTFAPFPGRKAAMKKAPFVAAALATAPLALTPNPADAQPGNSAPGLSVGPHVVPLPADTPYPGTMALKVDATHVARWGERRLGKECGRKCRFRRAPTHITNKTKKIKLA